MDKSIAIKYYAREDIQKAILKFSANREIAVRYHEFFGKRPDVIEYLSDVKKFVKNKVSSFHCSEERWINPLILSDKNLSFKDKENNRSGWDLILDLDGVDFIYARIAGKIIIDFLFELGIKNVSSKFSGNKGFHIGIPFEAFSSNIIGIGDTRKLFPDVARKIAAFLMFELRGRISKAILDEVNGDIGKIAKKYGFEKKDLIVNDEGSYNLDYLKLIEIDTILIASRHLFRMPYSLNEKSGLASIPIKNEDIGTFKRSDAEISKVKPENYQNFEFLEYKSEFGKDADILLIKAFEEVQMEEIEKIAKKVEKEKRGEKRGLIFTGDTSAESFEIEQEVERKDFPKTIDYILNLKIEDGKKRALFVLLTFLYSIKWNEKVIEEVVKTWNLKQDIPLRDNYIHAQFNWFRSLGKVISPPNFSNEEYYKALGVPENIILKDRLKFKGVRIKNPLHYVFVLLKRRHTKEEDIGKNSK